MQIIAKVFEFEISEQELERECAKVSLAEREKCLEGALKRLIDRCLLLYKAMESGIKISDKQWKAALKLAIPNTKMLYGNFWMKKTL